MAIEDFQDYPYIYDLDLNGGVTPTGEIKQVWNQEAFSNAIKMWIASYKGEFMRAPNRGGYVASWLLKPMTTVDVDSVKHSIRDGLSQDFGIPIVIRRLDVTSNPQKRYWEIYMELYSPAIKSNVIVSEKIKGTV